MAIQETGPRPQPEKVLSQWIPIRKNTLGEQPPVMHGLIGWNPQEIPLGTGLEIDVIAINELIQKLHLPQVTIRNFDPQRVRFIPIVVTTINEENPNANRTKTINPKGTVTIDPFSKSYVIALNFEKTKKDVESKMPKGINDPKFLTAYGKALNHQIKRSLRECIALNTSIATFVDPEIRYESSIMWGMKIYSVLNAMRILYTLPTLTPEMAQVELGGYFIVLLAAWNISQIPRILQKKPYRLYPKNVVDFDMIPNLVLNNWNKPLIRGK